MNMGSTEQHLACELDISSLAIFNRKKVHESYNHGPKLRLSPYLSILMQLDGQLPGAVWGNSLQCGARFFLALFPKCSFLIFPDIRMPDNSPGHDHFYI